MLPVINIGPAAVQTPGLILILGLWISLAVLERPAKRAGLDPNQMYNLALIALAAGLVGARLTYAALHLEAFSQNPLAVVAISPTMFNLAGGVFIGIVTAFIMGQKKGYPLWPVLDAFTPGIAVFLAVIALSQLAAGTAFGRPTSLPWGIHLWGAVRHPTQLYALAFFALIAALLFFWQRRGTAGNGTLFWRFIGMSAGALLFLEYFRGDSTLLVGSLRTAQVAAWVILALALFQLGRRQDPAGQKPS